MDENTKPEVEGGFEQATLAAWRGDLGLMDLLEAANRLAGQGQNPLAAVLYRTWLQRNRTPHNHLIWFNLGVLLFGENDLAGAREAYSQALNLAPAFLQPRFNLGLVHERLGQNDAAIAQWLWIETHARADDPEQRPFLLLALNNLGRHHEDHGRLADALACLSKSLLVEPQQPDVIHHWVFLRAKQCLWPVYEPMPGLDEDLMRRCTSALAMISLSEDPQAQLEAARQFVHNKVELEVPRLAPDRPYGHERIRIGYCSGDLCLHPVAMLTVELFELHDRNRFEIYGFDWSREDGSSLRQRVIDGMDHFERIHGLSDADAAALIRRHEIDILVDLQGQTLGARANMLAWRPAPIQITYLGLPATTGLPFIDHVIADRFLIPESAQPFYSERPLYLPDVYQVSDRQRQSSPAPTRQSCGLPDGAFVFCSFNNNYKYTPEMFGVWMDILRRVPGSVLWLLADNPWAQENLRREALVRGVSDDRLVFAPRALPPDYLARYAVADLFLDAYPFNGGTTANDALWMGLPVLTRAGQTFASRMAGALLTAAGLPELVTDNPQAYADKAVALAMSGADCRHLREQLRRVRAEGALFDTPRFVRNLEQAFRQLVADAA
ncbi:MAG: tetratricopeptide repeat protein [Rubrivivax sp.]|nr:tetratricopeptide repeat protein [Rubrivivax sp.]